MTTAQEPNWYLQEWARAKGKRQADLARDLGWLKSATYQIWHGKQPYRRDILNAVAKWLDIEPYELLMHPQEADALRRIRLAAQLVVAEHNSNVYREDFSHNETRTRRVARA